MVGVDGLASGVAWPRQTDGEYCAAYRQLRSGTYKQRKEKSINKCCQHSSCYPVLAVFVID
ncbi:unnamed protein product [Ixodes persulcatus]